MCASLSRTVNVANKCPLWPGQRYTLYILQHNTKCPVVECEHMFTIHTTSFCTKSRKQKDDIESKIEINNIFCVGGCPFSMICLSLYHSIFEMWICLHLRSYWIWGLPLKTSIVIESRPLGTEFTDKLLFCQNADCKCGISPFPDNHPFRLYDVVLFINILHAISVKFSNDN